jgi:putative flippase GtrA
MKTSFYTFGIRIFQKYKMVILYLFFGGCTTLINIVVYYVLYEVAGVSNLISTIFAWIVSVLFAFVTNRNYVFESEQNSISARLKEVVMFFSCRLLTGVLDVIIMVVAVDFLHGNSLIWKIISNILVILLNYIASKLVIFKKKDD